MSHLKLVSDAKVQLLKMLKFKVFCEQLESLKAAHYEIGGSLN